MTAATVDDVDLDRLADELLDQADELEHDDDDQADDEDAPAPAMLDAFRPRPSRRQITDPTARSSLLELVGPALEAKVAHDVEDDDRTLDALERTALRAGELADVVRTRLAALPPAPVRWTA